MASATCCARYRPRPPAPGYAVNEVRTERGGPVERSGHGVPPLGEPTIDLWLRLGGRPRFGALAARLADLPGVHPVEIGEDDDG